MSDMDKAHKIYHKINANYFWYQFAIYSNFQCEENRYYIDNGIFKLESAIKNIKKLTRNDLTTE